MPKASSVVQTPNASRYLQQLCKHFAHKVAVEHTPTHGRAELPGGLALFEASDQALQIDIDAADDEGLKRAKFIVEGHLIRFGFREKIEKIDWREEAA